MDVPADYFGTARRAPTVFNQIISQSAFAKKAPECAPASFQNIA
jgi:hypothetical protein